MLTAGTGSSKLNPVRSERDLEQKVIAAEEEEAAEAAAAASGASPTSGDDAEEVRPHKGRHSESKSLELRR